MSLYVAGSAGERFGSVVRTRSAGDFLLRLSLYGPALRMPVHHHPHAYFCLVVRGGMDERRGHRRDQYAAGSLHFHPAGEPHAGDVSPAGATCLSIIPEGAIAGRIAAAPGESLPASAEPAATRFANRCHQAFRESDDASDLCLEAAALELVATLLRRKHTTQVARRPAWLDDVRGHLDLHFADGVTLAGLAARAGVHPVHLVRAFRRHVGVTPGDYLRRRRIEAARTSLMTSATPIAEIALAAGFSSQAHFTRVFHRAIGLPPAAYRRLHGRRPS
jgi:AraC family transcriptional regulator